MVKWRTLAKIAIFAGAVPVTAALSLASIAIWLPVRLLRRGGVGIASTSRRTLVVAPFNPGSQSGGSKAVEGLITSLSELGTTVGLIVPVSRPVGNTAAHLMGRLFSPLPVPEECRALAFGSRAVRDELRRHDIAVFEFAATGMYLLFGRLCGRRCVLRDHEVPVRKLLIDRDDSRGTDAILVMLRFASTYFVTAAMYSRAHTIIALTEEDAEAIRRWFPFVGPKVVAIPTPVEMPPGLECQCRSKDRNLIMVANFHHAPNVDGLRWFLEKCAPLLQSECTLHVCGLDAPLDGLPDQHGKVRVVRHGFVENPEDIIAMGSIAVAPIISGGGVRIKNLFLASLGMAIVTTPRGNEGIGFVHDRHALICNDPVDMARSIDALAGSPELAYRLGDAAKEHVRKFFGPSSIGTRLRSAVFGDLRS
jgi:glycosyltransferase involved in cell wall biosynthesis